MISLDCQMMDNLFPLEEYPEEADHNSVARFFVRETMKPWAETFYKSKAWQACRAGYMNKVGGLCEDCLANGIYTPAEIVHHKVELTPENINDPAIALSWSNLKAVCRECHAIEHGARVRRYEIDRNGRVMAKR